MRSFPVVFASFEHLEKGYINLKENNLNKIESHYFSSWVSSYSFIKGWQVCGWIPIRSTCKHGVADPILHCKVAVYIKFLTLLFHYENLIRFYCENLITVITRNTYGMLLCFK